MGTLFPASDEFPDFRHYPSLVIETARLGLWPMVITALLAAEMPRLARQAEPRAPFRITLVMPPAAGIWNFAVPVRETEYPNPHNHQETGDPTPRGRQIESGFTTSATGVPFFGVVDSNDQVVRNNHRGRLEAYARIAASTSGSTFV